MNTLAIIGALVLLFGGLIYAVYHLGATRAEERIHRWLAEKANTANRDAVDAHEQAERENEEIL